MKTLQFHSKAKDISISYLPKDAGRLLCNFSLHPIKYKEKLFPTVEHAFQYSKFKYTNTTTDESIIEVFYNGHLKTPGEAKRYGSKTGMKKLGIELDIKKWNEISVDIMKEILSCKIQQHKDIHNILLECKKNGIVLIHFSRFDMKWGCVYDHANNKIKKGDNLLGKLLMDFE